MIANVQRRLKRLRKGGVIAHEVAVIEPVQAGYGITAIISVDLERDQADLIDGFRPGPGLVGGGTADALSRLSRVQYFG